MSDHNAISFSFNTFYIQVEKPKVKVAQKNFLNFDNSEVNAFFNAEIDSRFNYVFKNSINSNFQISIYDQDQINNLYSILCKTYTDSCEETLKFQNSFYPYNKDDNLGSEHMSKDMKRSKP